MKKLILSAAAAVVCIFGSSNVSAQSVLDDRTIEVQIGFSNSGGGARFWNAFFPHLRDQLSNTRIRPVFNDAANGARAVSAVLNDDTDAIKVGFVRAPEIALAEFFEKPEIDFQFADANWLLGVEQEGFVMAARSGLPTDPDVLRTSGDKLFVPVSDIEATHATAAILLNAITGIPAEIVVGFKRSARQRALIAGEVAFYTIAMDDELKGLIDEGLIQELYTIVPDATGAFKPAANLEDYVFGSPPEVVIDYMKASRAMGRGFFTESGLSDEELEALRVAFASALKSDGFAKDAKEQGVPFSFVDADAFGAQARALSTFSDDERAQIEAAYQCGLEMSEGTKENCGY